MEPQKVHIKCPHCGALLAIMKFAGIENKMVTCPVCKEKAPYNQYREMAAPSQTERTHYPEEKTETDETEIDSQTVGGRNNVVGCLKWMQQPSFVAHLKPGRNVIGRKASASSATVQVPVVGERRMSREHLVIDVKKVPGKGWVHGASLYKEKVNATFVNDEKLEFGDCIVLKHRDLLKLPDATFLFEIPDEDETLLND